MTGVADPIARAREIVAFGVNLVLFHRSIDEEVTRGAAWDDQARQTVDALCNLGLDVAVAGGVESDVITLLGRSPLYAIVVGRAISAQADPAAAARALAKQIRQTWPQWAGGASRGLGPGSRTRRCEPARLLNLIGGHYVHDPAPTS